jgi:outer membrane protein assembly factor BamD (BamD/ComL family)
VNQFTNLLIIIFSFFFLEVSGQPTYSSLDITKPAKYENRTLGAEKTDTKNFKKPRHFIQNTITHYNYYFNANNKINEILFRAKEQHKDDYTKLLSFYNYTLAGTAKDKRELDSVIYKATTGILNHDLRNDWIDNLYLLMGKAFYFSNKLDSAYITFQYVNYVFAPKEEGGYDRPIGSNADLEQGGSTLTVSTEEKLNILKKTFSLPPSRNESFIWQVKTFIARGSMGQASSLIQILKHDPKFPERLKYDLEEVQALWFYQQAIYDSTAFYLERALPNATNREEVARWEYLIAQLYERIKQPVKAQEFYRRVIQHTYNPVMDVYARLNFIRQNQGTDEKLVAQNIAAMESMARKERYADYRDIIYYTAAQIELENNNRPAGINFLIKCTKNALPGSSIRDKAFVQLGSLEFFDKKYRAARNYYDSVNVASADDIDSFQVFSDRKKALDKIVTELNIIQLQDSLQRIAAMSPADRDAYIKKLVKLLRKQQGLKEDNDESFTPGVNLNGFNNRPNDPFGSTAENADWYFNNSALKSRGFNDFRAKWGNRPNADNWFLSSLVAQSRRASASGDADRLNGISGKNTAPKEITFQSLQDNLPLTSDKLKKSNDSIENALFRLGKDYQEGLPDYYYAINTYDTLLFRFTNTHHREEALFNLYYCYLKIGDDANAKRIIAMMKQEYPSGKFTRLLTNPDEAMNPDALTKTQATKRYEDIYTAFIEGRFEEAIAKKKSADSLYGSKYWTPQLLFIEAVYYIHDEQDSLAKLELNRIIARYAGTPMAEKAKTFLDVLSRRKQIEDYLTNLKIERAKEDSVVVIDDRSVTRTMDTSQMKKQNNDDTVKIAKAKIDLGKIQPGRQKQVDTSQLGMQKIKIDNVQLTKIKTNAAQLAALQQQMDSIAQSEAKKIQKTKADSIQNVLAKARIDSIKNVMQKLKSDSERLSKNLQTMQSVFAFTPDKPHNVAILITKVDQVYVTETRNAFNRYNRENYYNKKMDINNVSLDDSVKIVVISGFDNATDALSYLDQARKIAPREVIPWLPANKYSFLIISDENLGRLKTNKDITEYKKFLSAFYPGKF